MTHRSIMSNVFIRVDVSPKEFNQSRFVKWVDWTVDIGCTEERLAKCIVVSSSKNRDTRTIPSDSGTGRSDPPVGLAYWMRLTVSVVTNDLIDILESTVRDRCFQNRRRAQCFKLFHDIDDFLPTNHDAHGAPLVIFQRAYRRRVKARRYRFSRS